MPDACLRCVVLRPSDDPCPECGSDIVAVDGVHPSVEAASSARDVFDALRSWQRRQAQVQRLEPYMVFPNKTLALLALRQPADRAALRAVPGVGPVKDRNYGYTVTAWFAQRHAGGEAPAAPAVVPAPIPDGLVPDQEVLLHDVRTAREPVGAMATRRDLDLAGLAQALAALVTAGAPDVAHMVVTPLDMATATEWLDAGGEASVAALEAAFPHTGPLFGPVVVALHGLRHPPEP